MNFFKNCITLDDAKNLYRKLCHQLHPDKGGKAKDFIQMRNEFKAFKPKVKTEKDNNFNFDNFEAIVYKFEVLNNISINFVGSFIWLEDVVKGATYEQKEVIKSISLEGFNVARYARKKKAWYFSPLDYKKKGRKNYSLDSIKNKFGCNTYQAKKMYITA